MNCQGDLGCFGVAVLLVVNELKKLTFDFGGGPSPDSPLAPDLVLEDGPGWSFSAWFAGPCFLMFSFDCLISS